MKILFYLLWSLLPFSKPNIENLHIPSCKNCIHFAPSYMNDFTSSLNKCKKFGTKDIITDEIVYNYASSCRRDENKCGHEGKFFIQEKNINFKIFLHELKNKSLWLILLFVTTITSLHQMQK